MRTSRRFQRGLAFSVVLVAALSTGAQAQAPSSGASGQATGIARRDGQHDFDFEIGTWKTHLKRLVHPLTGSSTWVEYEGTTVVRKVWNGRANLVELQVDGAAGHIEALSLRLYNPQAHQWSLNFANSADGSLSQPTIGEFKDGRGEFYDQETLNGRAILVRFVISDITPDSCRFEQAFSDDGGKTWEVNWIATDARVKNEPDPQKTGIGAKPAASDWNHDFDFEAGSWKIHLKRRLRPLTGSRDWVEFEGTSVTRKVWDGRAWLEEFDVASPTGRVEGLTLRLYNPRTQQWSLYWANAKDGAMGGPPNIGQFRNGRGEFYCQDTFNGRAIFIRYAWSDITANSAHFEQAFSDDGGTTWEVNWVTDQSRVEDGADRGR